MGTSVKVSPGGCRGHEFTIDLRILHLGGCQIVLGVNWMRTVSPLIFDFNILEVTFERGGRILTLTRCVEGGECKVISRNHLKRLFKQGRGSHSSVAIGVCHLSG